MNLHGFDFVLVLADNRFMTRLEATSSFEKASLEQSNPYCIHYHVVFNLEACAIVLFALARIASMNCDSGGEMMEKYWLSFRGFLQSLS